MPPYRVHILYEHGADLEPFPCSHIRLLRPLMHPSLAAALTVTASPDFTGEPADVVIVDRLWRPDVSPKLAEELHGKVSAAGARLIYAVDDNFFELVNEHKDWVPTSEQLQVVEYFVRRADAVIVTTSALQQRLCRLSTRITIIPNALDERLIAPQRRSSLLQLALRGARLARRRLSGAPKIIGYMGTPTHDDDLKMILPALRAISARHAGRVRIEILGILAHMETLYDLEGLPTGFFDPGPEHHREYPAFLPWFTRTFWWDIALAPLQDTAFNQYKSDIKFLDYAAISTSGIYSRLPVYASSVCHLKTGWLTDNDPGAWEEALETLLNDNLLCLRMGYNAARYLHRKRTLAKTATTWLSTIEAVLAR